MILDEQSIFSNYQSITGTCASENILDLGAREVSFGTPVELYIQITESFDSLTSLTIQIQTSEDEDFTTPVTLLEHTVLLEDLTEGTVLPVKFLPKGNLGYMRLYYTVTGTEPTQGQILAGLADGIQESFHNA
ncbi:MAG: hypothetical protein LUG16_01120 [Candidatus Gastranaerophilales bacterium]|nr:hypothetical protein [Candidatus Gastranaerophilales bacterium]